MNNKAVIKVRELAMLLHDGFFKKNILFRYVTAGVIGASTNLGFLFLFTHFFKIWYLFSSVLSFVIAIFVSFTLQKFWTFGDRETERIKHQFGKYLIGAILGLCLNAGLMYLFVEGFVLWYILAQFITNIFIAVLNFFMYKFFVFRKTNLTV